MVLDPDSLADFWPNRPLILGILNVTPDSFNDGGRYFSWEKAVAHGLRLTMEGADLLDVGGESTRPGATPVSPEDELERILPVIRALRGEVDLPICVDTRRAMVADAALEQGACWVNDVSGMRDPAMAEVVAQHEAGIILMHMQGDPTTMQNAPRYNHVVEDVARYLELQAAVAEANGISGRRIWVDPGIGFGKTLQQNLALMAGLDRIAELGYPVVLGASRKNFIGQLTREIIRERLAGSLAAAGLCLSLRKSVVRTHDVSETRQYLTVRRSLEKGVPLPWEPGAVPARSSRS